MNASDLDTFKKWCQNADVESANLEEIDGGYRCTLKTERLFGGTVTEEVVLSGNTMRADLVRTNDNRIQFESENVVTLNRKGTGLLAETKHNDDIEIYGKNI